ncbi:hypothetical protein GWK47_040820 [Chionoecetes opilio]|uniref:Uncharacterized protein n=1 Tax=Chionoecetes opilio TaxID=41210 RepID=A0A8J4YJG4_CHIOP|nr:hypothetical protein GWK47_040820 [Chionoecetes opilio]
MNKYQVMMLCLAAVLASITVAVLVLLNHGYLEDSGGFILFGVYFIVLVMAFALIYAGNDYASNTKETNVEDQPPSYESVTAKPPPYYYLFAEAPPASDVTPGTLSTHRLPASWSVPVHNNMVQPFYKTSCYPTARHEALPPLYSEVMTDNRPRMNQSRPHHATLVTDAPLQHPSMHWALQRQLSSPS